MRKNLFKEDGARCHICIHENSVINQAQVSIFYSQFIKKKLYWQMNTRNPAQFYPYFCYTFWINPDQNQLLNPFSLFPQALPPQLDKIDTNEQIREVDKNLGEEMIQQVKQIREEGKQTEKQPKIENQKKKITKKQSQKQKTTKTADGAKAKRPLTYQTQKSFYMKQKLKGKMKSNYRILRKRTSQTLNNSIKNKLRTSNTKKQKKETQKAKKIQKIQKIQEKEQKTPKKTKTRVIKQFCESQAIIPPLICGIQEMNQFILIKIENLKLRQLGKK